MWFIFWVAVIGAAVAFVMSKKQKSANRKVAFNKFAEENDFKVDYNYLTVIAIDAKTKSLILSSDHDNYAVYPENNIVRMEKYNANGGKGVAQWQIKFTTRSLATPQVFVPFANNVERNLWYDRIYALWNGAA